MQLSVLATGSSGNCFYVQGNGSGFLIDAGISCAQIRSRLESIGKDVRDLRGIFVTHEHSDHVRGLRVLSKRFRIPVFISQGTYRALSDPPPQELVRPIHEETPITIDNCVWRPLAKHHDANEPLAFSISYQGRTASFLTDIGTACDNVRRCVASSDVLVLESNYDQEMLATGPYPAYLKQRIASSKGHLSNYEAALLVLEHAPRRLKQVVLSHLSRNNNTPELAYNTFSAIMRQREDLRKQPITLGERHRASQLLQIP